jgi:hypothetical protein
MPAPEPAVDPTWEAVRAAVRLPVDLGAIGAHAARVDWARLGLLARRHRVVPLVWAALRHLCPPEAAGELSDYAQAVVLRSRVLVAEMFRLLEAFSHAGVGVVVHKGPPLAAQAYGDPNLRESGDLDLLVAEADLDKALACLRGLGYVWRFPASLTPRRDRAHRRTWNEYELESPDGIVVVDLHWRFAPGHYPFRVDPRPLLSSPATARVGGRAVPVFPPEAVVVLLALHGGKDRWSRLAWLVDLDRFLRASPALDWEAVLRLACAGRAARALGLGLHLVHELLGSPVPPPVREAARLDEELRAWELRIAAELRRGEVRRTWWQEGLDLWPHHFALCDSVRDRVRYALRCALVPRDSDWIGVPLPDALFPLYHLVRPVRLLHAAWRLRAGRAGS